MKFYYALVVYNAVGYRNDIDLMSLNGQNSKYYAQDPSYASYAASHISSMQTSSLSSSFNKIDHVLIRFTVFVCFCKEWVTERFLGCDALDRIALKETV